mmetsp:Transcript_28812/g.67046  ORF Transcript_28812/g.67046 Transcript_28812/m.67046 type:complete len:808 (-) Transcript_28812:47-2470(-)
MSTAVASPTHEPMGDYDTADVWAQRFAKLDAFQQGFAQFTPPANPSVSRSSHTRRQQQVDVAVESWADRVCRSHPGALPAHGQADVRPCGGQAHREVAGCHFAADMSSPCSPPAGDGGSGGIARGTVQWQGVEQQEEFSATAGTPQRVSTGSPSKERARTVASAPSSPAQPSQSRQQSQSRPSSAKAPPQPATRRHSCAGGGYSTMTRPGAPSPSRRPSVDVWSAGTPPPPGRGSMSESSPSSSRGGRHPSKPDKTYDSCTSGSGPSFLVCGRGVGSNLGAHSQQAGGCLDGGRSMDSTRSAASTSHGRPSASSWKPPCPDMPGNAGRTAAAQSRFQPQARRPSSAGRGVSSRGGGRVPNNGVQSTTFQQDRETDTSAWNGPFPDSPTPQADPSAFGASGLDHQPSMFVPRATTELDEDAEGSPSGGCSIEGGGSCSSSAFSPAVSSSAAAERRPSETELHAFLRRHKLERLEQLLLANGHQTLSILLATPDAELRRLPLPHTALPPLLRALRAERVNCARAWEAACMPTATTSQSSARRPSRSGSLVGACTQAEEIEAGSSSTLPSRQHGDDSSQQPSATTAGRSSGEGQDQNEGQALTARQLLLLQGFGGVDNSLLPGASPALSSTSQAASRRQMRIQELLREFDCSPCPLEVARVKSRQDRACQQHVQNHSASATLRSRSDSLAAPDSLLSTTSQSASSSTPNPRRQSRSLMDLVCGPEGNQPPPRADPLEAALLARILSSLPKVKANSQHREPCAICLEVPSQGESLTTLPCYHLFHTECIREWLAHSRLCPLCKTSVVPGAR